jgi:hypothetical protein
MAQSPPAAGNHDDLAALFSPTNELSPHDGSDTAADTMASFADTGNAEPTDEASMADALYGDAPDELTDTPSTLEASYTPAESQFDDTSAVEDDTVRGLCTVTNPMLTLSVAADLIGATQRVTLSPELRAASESRLAEEIVALADLARLQGQAGLLPGIVNDPVVYGVAREGGVDLPEELASILDDLDMPLPAYQEADAKHAEVFATLYAPDN